MNLNNSEFQFSPTLIPFVFLISSMVDLHSFARTAVVNFLSNFNAFIISHCVCVPRPAPTAARVRGISKVIGDITKFPFRPSTVF